MKHLSTLRVWGRIVIVWGSVWFATCVSPVVAHDRDAAPTVLYTLGSTSAFLSGCITGPCLCPVSMHYLTGTFGLAPSGAAEGFQSFAVSDIDWFTRVDGKVVARITGSGAYFLGATTQRLVLDLLTDDAESIAVDSGVVPRVEAFPAIDVSALTAGVCYQDGVALETLPVTPRIAISLAGPGQATWSVAMGAGSYDVVAGSLQELRAGGGDFSLATTACLADDVVDTAVTLADPVDPGEGFWFVVRGQPQPGYDSVGPGQVGSRDPEIAASLAACP